MRRGRKPARKMARGGPAGRAAMGRKPVRGTTRRRPITTSKSRGRVARGATSPMRGRALGNTRAMEGKRPTRGTRVMGVRGRQKYQTGGYTGNNYQNGGSILNGSNPCPNHPDLNYPFFITQPTTIAGTSEFFCCQNAIRDENCTQFDDLTFLEGLVNVQYTNMET